MANTPNLVISLSSLPVQRPADCMVLLTRIKAAAAMVAKTQPAESNTACGTTRNANTSLSDT